MGEASQSTDSPGTRLLYVTLKLGKVRMVGLLSAPLSRKAS